MKNKKFKKAAQFRKVKALFLTILVLGTLGSLLLYSTDTQTFLEMISSLSGNAPEPSGASVNYP